jgi:Flp pilus assembly protein TadB
MTPLLAAVLAATAVVIGVPGAQAPRSRLARLAGRDVSTAHRSGGAWLPYASPLAVVALGAPGLLLTAAVVVALRLWSRDGPRRRERLREAELLRSAPLVCELLASCLESGADVVTAARTVAASVGEPMAEPLIRYAARLAQGAPHRQAIDHMGAGVLDRLGAVLSAGDDAGPGLAAALRSMASDERAQAASSAQAAGKRAGVWAVGPLTLCFLPAFVLVGVVPVVVATFGDLLR